MQQEKSKIVKHILDRLSEHKNLEGIKGLASFLGKKSSTLYGWIRNGNISDEYLLLTKIDKLNPEYLRTGQGPILIEETPEEHPVRTSGTNPVVQPVRTGWKNKTEPEPPLYSDKGNHLIVITQYRGTNSFGAVVTESVTAETLLDCSVKSVNQ